MKGRKGSVFKAFRPSSFSPFCFHPVSTRFHRDFRTYIKLTSPGNPQFWSAGVIAPRPASRQFLPLHPYGRLVDCNVTSIDKLRLIGAVPRKGYTDGGNA